MAKKSLAPPTSPPPNIRFLGGRGLFCCGNTPTEIKPKKSSGQGIICTKLHRDMSERCITVPDCQLDGTLYLNRTFLKSSISSDVSFMPKDFCSADDVRSLFACDNDMTVSDLLCRISNYPQVTQFQNMNTVTDFSQWKLYDVRSERGSDDVLKMFNYNFRVLVMHAHVFSCAYACVYICV